MNKFDEAIARANEEHRATVNEPTRCQSMLVAALAVMDGFKMNATRGTVGCTEAEFLAGCKRAYWKAREAWQKPDAAELKAGSQ